MGPARYVNRDPVNCIFSVNVILSGHVVVELIFGLGYNENAYNLKEEIQ